MEASISQLKTVHQSGALTVPKTVFSCTPPVQLKRRAIFKCAKEAEKMTMEKEVIMEEMKKLNEKCNGGGIVEVMECLEREAIMGEDQGREAIDYNRRALIFDNSSRVFQALKHSSSAF